MSAPTPGVCEHRDGHSVFLGREIPGRLDSPEITGWQCWGCDLIFRSPPVRDSTTEATTQASKDVPRFQIYAEYSASSCEMAHQALPQWAIDAVEQP